LIWKANQQSKRPSRRGRDSAILHFCTLTFAFSTYLSCHEFIATEPPFLPMDYFSVFSAFSLAISFVPPWLCGHESIMQNKPNFKMGNINISTARTKAYANEQRTMNTKRYPKQTQSNPIPPRFGISQTSITVQPTLSRSPRPTAPTQLPNRAARCYRHIALRQLSGVCEPQQMSQTESRAYPIPEHRCSGKLDIYCSEYPGQQQPPKPNAKIPFF